MVHEACLSMSYLPLLLLIPNLHGQGFQSDTPSCKANHRVSSQSPGRSCPCSSLSSRAGLMEMCQPINTCVACSSLTWILRSRALEDGILKSGCQHGWILFLVCRAMSSCIRIRHRTTS